MTNLRDELSGEFWVFTETGSQYTVDITNGTLCRDEATHELRGDGALLELLSIVTCEVGSRAMFVVQIPGVEAVTVRSTSGVTQILAIEGGGVRNG